MAKKKINWSKVVVGAAIIGVSIADIVPGDEVIAVPVGAYMLLDGLTVLD